MAIDTQLVVGPEASPRERFIAALERRPLLGRVPHFELVFFLTMEAFGQMHVSQRSFGQWDQMEEKERALHRIQMAEQYIAVAERYDHSAIFIHPNPNNVEETEKLIALIRERTGARYFLMMHGDPTFAIPDGAGMLELASRMAEEPEGVKREAADRVKWFMKRGERLRIPGGLDGFALCADYCFNTNPFMSPAHFSEFVTPYLAEITAAYRAMGYYVIKHTDGNIMPILDQLVQTHPHALHSLDPQGGVDMAEVKRVCGKELCLIGNVSCAALDAGTDDEVIASTRYALRHGMPGGGYIFSTSNCIYTGMPLARYELMLKIWREEGNYITASSKGFS